MRANARFSACDGAILLYVQTEGCEASGQPNRKGSGVLS